MVTHRTSITLGLLLGLMLAGCDKIPSGADCWPLLRAKHTQLYFAIDSRRPQADEIDDAREELRITLNNCAADASFAARAAIDEQAIESTITLLDLAILADHVDLTASLFRRLESDTAASIAAHESIYGGLHLQTAAFAESPSVVGWLLSHDTDPNEPDEIGLTPLHASSARTEGGLIVIRTLVQHGADIDRSAGSGYTPLMSGRQQGDLRKVQCLLALGARAPVRSELVELQGSSASFTDVEAVDDLLTSSERRVPERIAAICSR